MFYFLEDGGDKPYSPLYLVTIADYKNNLDNKPFIAWIRQKRFMRKPFYVEYGRYKSYKKAWKALNKYDCGYD